MIILAIGLVLIGMMGLFAIFMLNSDVIEKCSIIKTDPDTKKPCSKCAYCKTDDGITKFICSYHTKDLPYPDIQTCHRFSEPGFEAIIHNVPLVDVIGLKKVFGVPFEVNYEPGAKDSEVVK